MNGKKLFSLKRLMSFVLAFVMVLGLVPMSAVKVEAEEAPAVESIAIPESAELNYYGQGYDVLPGQIWDALDDNAVVSPEGADVSALKVLYVARAAQKIPVTVKIPFVGEKTIEVPVTELWLEPGHDLSGANTEMPSTEELLAGIDYTKLLDLEYLKAEFTKRIGLIGAHAFGAQATEQVKVTVGAVESNTATLALVDLRTATEIKLNEGVEMTYGFTADDLAAALIDGVYVQGGDKIADAVATIKTNVTGMEASAEARTIKVVYAGDINNKPAEATATIIVKKAPVDVVVDNVRVEYNTAYELPVSTTPADVDTIKFIGSLKLQEDFKGVEGEVQVILPGVIQNILGNEGVVMTASQLQELLLTTEGIAKLIDSEVVNVLMSILTSLPTEVADLKVRLGGDVPTCPGLYLVGAVSADKNYETDFGVGVMLIAPDEQKAEIDWIQKDAFIVTRDLLTQEGFDMGAEVISVADGKVEAANEKVVELFLGVDLFDGKFAFETEQDKLGNGAYVEVALVVDTENLKYYAEPIARPVVVMVENVDVEFVDANGANADRRFTFDNTGKTMDVVVSREDGSVLLDTRTPNENIENLKLYYAGISTDAEELAYLSTVKPVHVGAYTVVAVYASEDSEGVRDAGLAVGAMTIEPADVTLKVDVADKIYGNQAETYSIDMVTSPVYGDDVVDTLSVMRLPNGTINIDFPAVVDSILEKVLPGVIEDGITLKVFVANFNEIKAALEAEGYDCAKLEEILKMLVKVFDVTLSFKDLNEVRPTELGTYTVMAMTFDSDYKLDFAQKTYSIVEAQIIDTGRTLSLDGVIYINQYAKVEGYDADLTKDAGLLVWKTPVTEETAVYSDENAIVGLIASGDEYFQQTHGIAAKEYADVLYLRVYVKTGENAYAYGPLKEYSVREYCDKVFANADTNEEAAALVETCEAMLHYGAAAQEYFGYNTANLANAGIAAPAEWNAELINAVAPFTTNIEASDKVEDTGRTLSLDGAIVVNSYYKYAGTAKTAEYLVWDGVDAELTADNVSYTVDMKAVGSEFLGQTKAFAAKEYDKTVYVCARFVDEDGTVHYSDVVAFHPEQYAANVLEKAAAGDPSAIKVEATVKAMVTYGQCAGEYFGTK